MICGYGKIFKQEAEKHNLKVLNMDDDFSKQINAGVKYFFS